MSNKIESLLKGVGNVEEVFDACVTNCADYSGEREVLRNAVLFLAAALKGSDGASKIVLPTLAALLNCDLQRNGSLYFVGERGTVERETIIQSGTREAIAGLIA